MTFLIETQPVPLMSDSDGVVRVSGTRVTLDTIIYAFLDGATAEEIAQQYPSVPLSDIYTVLGFYLHQSAEVNAYLQQRKQLAAQVKHQNEQQFDPTGIRERLMARQSNKGS